MEHTDNNAQLIASLTTAILKSTLDDLDSYDEYGLSLIHYVTTLDWPEVIKALAERRADLNRTALGSNITPLIIAAALGNQRSVKALIKHGV
jgi:ankyrin repeat protein